MRKYDKKAARKSSDRNYSEKVVRAIRRESDEKKY